MSNRRTVIEILLSVALTALAGWGDEGIQAVLPNRYYELRDVGLNVAAGVLVVVSMTVTIWARRRDASKAVGRESAAP